MGEVVGVDKANQLVVAKSDDRDRIEIHYDYLIVATGATHSYFGHQEFAPYAPGLAGRFHLKCAAAWIPWMVVHIAFLARTGLRISVVLQWAWTFLTGQRGSRLIVTAPEPARAADALPFAAASAQPRR
jgi:NADH dehydrogenase FAD-containing subunit